MEEEKFLTSGETAKLLGISQDTLSRWGKKGKLIPHHVLPNGYRFYSKIQIREILSSSTPTSITDLDLVSKKNDAVAHDISDLYEKKELSSSKPLFRVYVNEGDGNKWVNYYAMRSAKTNALAYASNPKLFTRVTEFVGNQEILSEDDEYRFIEVMHNVTMILDSENLNNVNATVAKSVLWIQGQFTYQLGCNQPTDEQIEEARFIKWDIQDYMDFCNLKNRKRAIESMRNVLSLLSNTKIQWQEEIIVRDKDGKPVFTGNYRRKDGKYSAKIKKELHTFSGNFISTHDLHPVNGVFYFWINKEFAKYLAYAGVIAVHEKVFQLSVQKNSSAITLAFKLFEYFSMNKSNGHANVLKISSLLNAMPNIPKYSNLTEYKTVVNKNGDEVKSEYKGNKGGWKNRILKPFEDAFNTLVNLGILSRWQYRDINQFKHYEDFVNDYVYFELSISQNETTNTIEEGKS